MSAQGEWLIADCQRWVDSVCEKFGWTPPERPEPPPVREVGLPWFDRHATRGGREIYQWQDHDGPYIGGCIWTDGDAMRAFYAQVAAAGYPRMNLNRRDAPGFVRYYSYYPIGFDSWREAEIWLLSPRGGKDDA